MAPIAGAAIASCSILLLLLAPWAEGQPPEATSGGFIIEHILSEKGCGAFASLVAATPGVGEVFREKSAGFMGLTIFCPDDKAVAAFIPRFNNLTVDGQVMLLLYHGLAVAYSEEEVLSRIHWGWGWVVTLDRGLMLTIRHGSVMVILSSSTGNEARITKTAVDDDHLAVYLIDAVLIPTEPISSRHFWALLRLLVLGILAVVILGAACTCMTLFSLCWLGRWCQCSAARVAPQEQPEH